MSLVYKSSIMTGGEISSALNQIAQEIIQQNNGAKNLALVGIHTRGVPIATCLVNLIHKFSGVKTTLGQLDITLYRDDLSEIALQPIVKKSEVPFDVDGKRIVLCDDVLYTGRTIRAALNALIDLGRPERIQLAVLIDRGHREFPIHADYTGKNVPTSLQEVIKVKIKPVDSEEGVDLFENKGNKGNEAT